MYGNYCICGSIFVYHLVHKVSTSLPRVYSSFRTQFKWLFFLVSLGHPKQRQSYFSEHLERPLSHCSYTYEKFIYHILSQLFWLMCYDFYLTLSLWPPIETCSNMFNKFLLNWITCFFKNITGSFYINIDITILTCTFLGG